MKTNSNQLKEADAEQSAAMNAWPLIEVLRRGMWVIAVCASAGLVLGGGYAAMRADVFDVTATVQVEQETPSVVAVQDAAKNDIPQPDEDLKTVEQQLVARNLTWRVIRLNKLDQDPDFTKPGVLRSLLRRPVTNDDMINRMSKEFAVKLRRGTRLIDITVSHKKDPKVAQALARSLIDEYVSQNVEWLSGPSKEANKFLIDEADSLKRKVESAEQALQDYREKNHAVSLEEKQNIIVERLKNLNLRLAQVENDRIALESDVAQLEKTGSQPAKLLAIGSIANAQSVLDVQRISTDKEAAFAVLRQRYGPENPAYAQAERELRIVHASLDAAVLNASESLRAKYEAAKFAQQMSEKMLHEQEQAALDLNRMSIRYDVLSREVEADRALFETVVKRLKQMSVNQKINQIHLRIVDPPMLPESPNLKTTMLIAVLGVVGGTAIGLVAVIGRFAARPSVQSPEHGERVLGLAVIGAIPRMARLRGDASRLPGIAVPRSRAAESFRFLAASISGAGGRGSLLLTGASRGVGSTSCAIGCAIAFARSGVRTLLIEADLKEPLLGRSFALQKDASGLAECLAGRSTLEASIVPTKVENLFVLTAGAAPDEIAALFSSPAFGELIAKAAGDFGQVVIDSPSVTSASETLLIARHAGAVFIVAQTGQTAIGAASRACQLLEGVNRKPAGLILTRVPRRMMV